MPVFDIPVLFQVNADDEEIAALSLAASLARARVSAGWNGMRATEYKRLVDPYTGIESWHTPNHKFADRSDVPVRVDIVKEG